MSDGIPATIRIQKRLCGPESEPTPVTITGLYNPETDTFSYRTLGRGAQERNIQNAGENLAEAVINGAMVATVLESNPIGFNQDQFYRVQLWGWNGTTRVIDAFTAGSGLLNPGDIICLPIHSPNGNSEQANSAG